MSDSNYPEEPDGELPTCVSRHPAWQRIRDRDTPSDRCDPFCALGVQRREQSYSRLLAWLLAEPACHAFATAWIDTVVDPATAPAGYDSPYVVGANGRLLTAADLHRTNLAAEAPLPNDQRIDLVARYTSRSTSGGSLVVAVENKIGAGESPDQLDSYARELLRQYPDPSCHIILVFLTPRGRAPETLSAVPDDRLHPRVFSWERIAALLNTHSPDAVHLDHLSFTRSIQRHIKESLMGETPARMDTQELFDDPDCARTLLRICQAQPLLGDMLDAWVERVREWLASKDPAWRDIVLSVYPTSFSRGIREIKIGVQRWDDSGIPLRFMIHNDETGHSGPAVRILIYMDHYDNNAPALNRLAELADGAIDPEYGRAWPGFPWQRVLTDDRESPEPESRLVHHYAYNEQTIEQCLENLRDQFSSIEPAIHRFLNQ